MLFYLTEERSTFSPPFNPSTMNRPVLYFTLGMLMHIPAISQPSEQARTYWSAPLSPEKGMGDHCRIEEPAGKLHPVDTTNPQFFKTIQFPAENP